MGFAPLLESNASGICKRLATKKKLLEKNKNKNNQLLTLSGASNNLAQHTHTSHRD